MNQQDQAPAKLLRLPDVIDLTGLSRSTIYRLQSHGQFPMGIKLTQRTTAWVAVEIAQWVASRAANRPLPASLAA